VRLIVCLPTCAYLLSLSFATLLSFAAVAQTPSPQTPSPQGATSGLEPAWDIAKVLGEIGVNEDRILPALERIDAKSWVAKGASETYEAQLDSSKQQVRAAADGAKALARNPEKLSASLELLFRLQGLETMLSSIGEGTRRYQGPQAAQALAQVYAEGGANRERFRQYIVNLAAEREQQFEVMDREAQQCRATLMAPPPPKTTGRKK
jgi:hypothetical protein